MNYLNPLAFLPAVPAMLAEINPVQDPQPLRATSFLGLDLTVIALAAGAIALVLLGTMIVSSLLSGSGRREVNNPRGLLRQLCDAHGFQRREQRVLLAAARLLAVQQPARFFLEPGLLTLAAKHPALASRRSDLLAIAGELFGPIGQP